MVMDEFARVGHAAVIARGFSYVAGYGLRLLPVLQSPAQLRAEIESEVGFASHEIFEERLPDPPIVIRVADGVFQPDLLQQAGLAPERAIPPNVGPKDRASVEGIGLPAQDGRAFHQRGADPVTGGGHGGADPGQAAPRHDEIERVCSLCHVTEHP